MSKQAFVNTHALERAIRQMSGGGALALEQKRATEGYDQLQEIECQIQVPIWGVASSGVGWNTFTVMFDVQFVFAPEQRDSPLAVPHFSFGPVVSGVPSPDGAAADANNPDSCVAIFCQVIEWARDLQTDTFVGAQLGIGVSTIGGSDVRFDGYVHLSFQGYGAVAEVPAAIPNVGG